MRYAFYFAPDRATPLAELAASWLGRDAATGKSVERPVLAGVGEDELIAITGPARRYGFHGTLKAPFRLAEGRSEQDLLDAAVGFCSRHAPFAMVPLVVGELDGFLALVPAAPSVELDAFAGEVVSAFDALRAPHTEGEIERRNPASLSLAELRNLMRWGYPYVFDCFRFHMTLTTNLSERDRSRVRAAAEDHFAPALGTPPACDALTLFCEPQPGAPFEIHSRVPLAARQQRKTA